MDTIKKSIKNDITLYSTPKFNDDSNEVSSYFAAKLFESNSNNNQINPKNNINEVSHEAPIEFQIDENFSLCSIKNNAPIIFKDKIDNENLEIIFKDSGTFNSSNTTKTNESGKDKTLFKSEKFPEFPEKSDKNIEKFENLKIEISENSNFIKENFINTSKNVEVEKSKNDYKYNLPLEQDTKFELINFTKMGDEDNTSSNSDISDKNSVKISSFSRNRNQFNKNYLHMTNINLNNNIYYSKNKKYNFNTINQNYKPLTTERVEKYHRKKVLKHYPTHSKIITSKTYKSINKHNSNFNEQNYNIIDYNNKKNFTPNRDYHKKIKFNYSLNKTNTIKNEKHRKKINCASHFYNLNNNNNDAKSTGKYLHKIKKWKNTNHLGNNNTKNIDDAIYKTNTNKNSFIHFKTNLNKVNTTKHNNKYFNENTYDKKHNNNAIISHYCHKNSDKSPLIKVNTLSNRNNTDINKASKKIIKDNISYSSLILYKKPHKIRKLKNNNITFANNDEIIKYSILRNNKMNKMSQEFSITVGEDKGIKNLKTFMIENNESTQSNDYKK